MTVHVRSSLVRVLCYLPGSGCGAAPAIAAVSASTSLSGFTYDAGNIPDLQQERSTQNGFTLTTQTCLYYASLAELISLSWIFA